MPEAIYIRPWGSNLETWTALLIHLFERYPDAAIAFSRSKHGMRLQLILPTWGADDIAFFEQLGQQRLIDYWDRLG